MNRAATAVILALSQATLSRHQFGLAASDRDVLFQSLGTIHGTT